MKRLLARCLAVAITVTTVAETVPSAIAQSASSRPALLEQSRATGRSQAMTALVFGDLQIVDRRWRSRRDFGDRRYGGGRYNAPHRAFGRRDYDGPRRHYGRRYHYDRGPYYRPGLYFGIGI